MGNAFQALGKIDQAVLSYQESIKIKPNFAVAYRNLSSVKKFKINDSEIDKMIFLLKKNDLPSKDLVNFNFALGKANNDINNYEKAYSYFSISASKRTGNLTFSLCILDILALFFCPLY